MDPDTAQVMLPLVAEHFRYSLLSCLRAPKAPLPFIELTTCFHEFSKHESTNLQVKKDIFSQF